jgi:hypothetical protein
MQPLRIATRNLMAGDAVYRPISRAARNFASSHTWPCVFQQLYETYEVGLQRMSSAPGHSPSRPPWFSIVRGSNLAGPIPVTDSVEPFFDHQRPRITRRHNEI